MPEADLLELQARLAGVYETSKKFTVITRAPDAQALWRDVYAPLSEGKPGLLGAILGRAEAQVTRLSLIFALLDASPTIREAHLRAALAAWKYVEETAAFVFGTKLGNPIADRVRAELGTAGQKGMTKTAIRDLFGNHRSTEAIDQALTLLHDSGLAHQSLTPGSGRWAETWFAGRASAKKAIEAKEGPDLTPLPSLPSHLSQGVSSVEGQLPPPPGPPSCAAAIAPGDESRDERDAIQGEPAEGSVEGSAA